MALPTSARIGVVGAGAAGLITTHTLLRDGFENVEVLTRDESPGGVWAAQRVYPGLSINKSVPLFVLLSTESRLALVSMGSSGSPRCRCPHLRMRARPEAGSRGRT